MRIAYKEIKIDWLEEVIAPAIDRFYATPLDRDLLERDANERAIVGIIFCHIRGILNDLQNQKPELNGLSVDLEYNRNYSHQKTIFIKCGTCNNQDCRLFGQRPRPRQSMPDIIIHQRNSNRNNQVVIEFKKVPQPRNAGCANDFNKLTYYTCLVTRDFDTELDYRFQIGMFIELEVSFYKVFTFKNATIIRSIVRKFPVTNET